jgi:signal peptidase I
MTPVEGSVADAGVASRPPDPPTGVGAVLPLRTGFRGGWTAFFVTAAARGFLVMLVGMLLWSVVPVVGAWQSTVVMSGSMTPRILPGDVVLVRPIPPDQVRPGQILLVEDPDRAGRLRLHRLVEISDDGRLVLKGDANAADDSTSTPADAVRGIAALRVPTLGLPALWLSEGRAAPLVATAVGLLGLGVGATLFRPDQLGPATTRTGSRSSAPASPQRSRTQFS